MVQCSELKLNYLLNTYTQNSTSTVIPQHINHLNHSSVHTNTIIAKADSGASRHFVRKEDEHILKNLINCSGPSVTLPDMTTISSTKSGNLSIAGLSSKATTAHVLPHLKSASLLSMGQLCDDDCNVILNKEKMTVIKNNRVVMQGKRNKQDGLWDVPFSNSKLHLNVMIKKSTLKRDLIKFYHGACFSPTKKTFLQAVKNGNFMNWPGLTSTLVSQHLETPIATIRGHMKQERKNLQSTKTTNTDFFPVHDTPNNTKTNEIVCTIIEFKSTKKAYGDLTGRFPFTSSRGSQYFLVVYHYDANAILDSTLKRRTAGDITNAYMKIYQRLQTSGNAPKTFILDNETSSKLLDAFVKNKIAFQKVPPHQKRRNAAERAIQTWKDHFLSGIASLSPEFPIHEWDRLVPQAEMTLNLLRNARSNPKLSSYAYLFGMLDFNATPLAPPGTKVVFHNKPEVRSSWDMRGDMGWYIGPALHHYRCVTIFKPTTRKELITDTVTFIPHSIPIPKVSVDDFLIQACDDIKVILNNKNDMIPSLQAGDTARNAVRQIAQALRQSIEIPPKQTTQHIVHPCTHTSQVSTNESYYTKSDKLNPAPLPRVQRHIGTPRIQPYTATPFRQQATAILQHITLHKDIPAFRPKKLQNIQCKLAHIFNEMTGKKETLDALREQNPTVWDRSLSNEWGRLASGNDFNVSNTDTIEFIAQTLVPQDRNVTYASFVCDYRPLKAEPYRVRIVVGGDRLSYENDAGSPAASLVETKLLLNSTISDCDQGATFFSADVKDFFLASPMARPEYMRVLLKHFPADIVRRYNLTNIVTKNGYIFIKIKKGMYGLKQAAVLAYNELVKNLTPFGYFPIDTTNGLWAHKTRKTKFCLCVDDFGVKTYNEDDTEHLLTSLKTNYKISSDMTGFNYCGLTIDWDYKNKHVDISMPNYINKLLHKLQHVPKKSPQYAPHKWTEPSYGKKRQYAKEPDTLPILHPTGIKYVQSVVGSLLYYSRAVDPTMLPALNEISAVQASPTEDTLKLCQMLLDYAATYPNAKVRFHKSDMILHVDSDAAYLVQPNARSRIAGSFKLSCKPPPAQLIPRPKPNAPI